MSPKIRRRCRIGWIEHDQIEAKLRSVPETSRAAALDRIAAEHRVSRPTVIKLAHERRMSVPSR